jgi:gluconolactonase
MRPDGSPLVSSRFLPVSRRDLLRAGAAVAVLGTVPRFLKGAAAQAPVTRPHRLLAEGLSFPEGPVALSDGSVLVVEIARRTLTRVDPDGGVQVVAQLRGGPNGAALGPDGACYVCNNGGMEFAEVNGILLPQGQSADHAGGWIERVDLRSGQPETLYHKVDGQPLSAPNDLVFDDSGGFWFTDLGRSGERSRDHGGIYYARADGSAIRRVVYPVHAPNGIGLSPDGKTLFVAEIFTGRLIAFDVTGPGELSDTEGALPGRFVAAGPGRYLFDSMAVEADGTISVAAPVPGEIVCYTPDGQLIEIVTMPGPLPTNLCFGGSDLRTAYITLAGHGQLIGMEWPRAGLTLN